MAKAPKLEEDPLVARLVPDPAQGPPDTTALRGYLGKGPAPAEQGADPVWRLYRNLELNEYVEIPESQIHHSQKLPDGQGTVVWVAKSVPLNYVRVQSSQVQAELLGSGPIAQARLQAASPWESPGQIIGELEIEASVGLPCSMTAPCESQICWSHLPCTSVFCPSYTSPCLSYTPSHCTSCPPPSATPSQCTHCPPITVAPSHFRVCGGEPAGIATSTVCGGPPLGRPASVILHCQPVSLPFSQCLVTCRVPKPVSVLFPCVTALSHSIPCPVEEDPKIDD